MSENAKNLSGAQMLVRCLEDLGVEYVFGYPGGAALPLFDALHHSPIQLVLVRHEQGATHMADGYARASGKPGVVLVTSGPGATNTVTGIYTAQMDSVPLVVICGQVPTKMIGKDAFQEVDIVNVTLPLVKKCFPLRHAKEVSPAIREAYHLACEGRPGPVLIDFPKDVAIAPCRTPLRTKPKRTNRKRSFSHSDVRKAARLLEKANRPLLLVGRGALISRAGPAVVTFAERFGLPVTNTLLGKGAFPETHPLSLGMLGMHGTAYANKAVTRCDLICSIGSRFDDRIVGTYETFCQNAKIIHIDIDPAEVGKVVKPDASLVGDAKEVIAALMDELKPLHTGEWLKEITALKHTFPISCNHNGCLTAKRVLTGLHELTKGKALITTDVGQHQMWAAQVMQTTEPNTWISSGGAGTMGFGFPAAIGASLARKDLPVIAVVGDGGFQMTLSELATAVNLKLPIKIVILDNLYLGMVRQWQEMFFENRLSGVELEGNPDFVHLAKAYGAAGRTLRQVEELPAVLSEALQHDEGPFVIHALIKKEENVFPMIPQGKSLEEMILDEEKEDGR